MQNMFKPDAKILVPNYQILTWHLEFFWNIFKKLITKLLIQNAGLFLKLF